LAGEYVGRLPPHPPGREPTADMALGRGTGRVGRFGEAGQELPFVAWQIRLDALQFADARGRCLTRCATKQCFICVKLPRQFQNTLKPIVAEGTLGTACD